MAGNTDVVVIGGGCAGVIDAAGRGEAAGAARARQEGATDERAPR